MPGVGVGLGEPIKSWVWDLLDVQMGSWICGVSAQESGREHRDTIYTPANPKFEVKALRLGKVP